jgi:predicted AAA+ superfamily ATPase
LIVGGLPEVVSEFAKDLDQVGTAYERARKKQESLIFQYMADIAKHSGKVNSMHIERVWSNAASQLATTHDGKSDKFKFKGVVPNIRGYERLAGAIEWLQKAGLIVKVPICKKPVSPLRGFTDDSVFKIYLFDVGILGAMIGLRPSTVVEYDFGSYKGYLAENFVARETVSQGIDLYCWRNGTSEVDFLIEDETGIVPIEVKSGQSNKAKSLGVFIKKHQPRHVVKLSGRCPDRRSVSDDYEQLPLYGIYAMSRLRN